MMPIEINIVKENLHIKWNDLSETEIKLVNLRRLCPCAFCQKEIEEKIETYIPVFNKMELTVEKISLSGNYGINICWKDGHSMGYYSFDYLRNISKVK